MSWLDYVLSVPAVGLRVKPSLTVAADHSRIIAPLIDELVAETGEANLTATPPAAIGFRTSDGFSHTLSLDNLVVEFAYPMTTRRATGKIPVTDPPKQKLYSDLASQAVSRLVKIVKCFDRSHRFKINRVGIVSASRLAREALPPGLISLAKHLESPWESPLIKMTCNFVATLSKAVGFGDQCHHVISTDTSIEEHPDEVEVRLDWQRVFTPEIDLSADEIEQKLPEWYKLAKAYFERVGEGALKIE